MKTLCKFINIFYFYYDTVVTEKLCTECTAFEATLVKKPNNCASQLFGFYGTLISLFKKIDFTFHIL